MQVDHPPIIGNSRIRAIFHFSIDTAAGRSTTAAISEKEHVVDLCRQIHDPLDFGFWTGSNPLERLEPLGQLERAAQKGMIPLYY
jgi:hypothetical protein